VPLLPAQTLGRRTFSLARHTPQSPVRALPKLNTRESGHSLRVGDQSHAANREKLAAATVPGEPSEIVVDDHCPLRVADQNEPGVHASRLDAGDEVGEVRHSLFLAFDLLSEVLQQTALGAENGAFQHPVRDDIHGQGGVGKLVEARLRHTFRQPAEHLRVTPVT
jgi:hypothetical protein